MSFRLKRQSFFWPKIIGITAFFLITAFWFFLFKPPQSKSASLTNASATLSNSRLSFYAVVHTGAAIGANAVNIKTTANTYPDDNTNHLFPGDTVSVGAEGNLTVASIFDTDTFLLSAGLTIPASDNDKIYATQSGTLTVTFDTVNAIPANGDVIVTIDAPSSGGNDGAPDTAETMAANGFDFNTITTTNITCPTGANWSKTSASAGSGGDGHTVVCTTNTEVVASTNLTIVVGDGDKGLVNPAAAYGAAEHTQGVADIYTVNVKTRNSDDQAIDESNLKVAPIEAVLVSATVDETLNFQVEGVSSTTSTCGRTTDKTTTPVSVPWGRLTLSETFFLAAQKLTVSTNAESGYVVKIEENDQMGKNGVACPLNGNEADNCIQDTTCNVTGCTEATSQDWTDATTYYGLGYSLENISGTDAAFLWNESSRTFSAKQIPSMASNESPLKEKQTIMSNAAPVKDKQIYVCYQIAFSPIQPAGYYYNQVRYTASATF